MIKKKKIIIYSTPTCFWCKKVKEYLESKNVKFDYIDITKDNNAMKAMIGLTGITSVPVISDGKNHVLGFNTRKIDELISSK